MQLFYTPKIEPNDEQFTFSTDESKHMIKVLRKQVGDQIHITNGKGMIFKAEVSISDAKKCMVTILNATLHPKPNYKLHLAVAPTKMNDRYEWFLEKATEIGVHEITPIICDHSERKVIKMERFEKVVQSAAKQSLQAYLPILNEPIKFSDFLQIPNSDAKYIAHCEEEQKTEFHETLTTQAAITVLIGPEGDFSTKEITQSITAGYQPVALGKNRLRTETAAIYAATVTAIKNNE